MYKARGLLSSAYCVDRMVAVLFPRMHFECNLNVKYSSRSAGWGYTKSTSTDLEESVVSAAVGDPELLEPSY